MIARRLFLRVSLAVVMVAACSRDADRPIDPVWGKQPCAQCAMIASDKASAAELVTDQGERLFFDDIGCMVVWLSEHQGKAKKTWVRSPDANGWIDAETAHFVAGARTPMDYGFLPTAQGGVTWEEMSRSVLARSKGSAP